MQLFFGILLLRELELRIETQKQTLQARDESIKKLLEMLQNKGMGKEEERIMFQQMQSLAQKQVLKLFLTMLA
uniref:Uncharacterized protein n=1 Tax=Vespula pensylvanica TaxID=30213 RepID=A0A834P1Q5_VESPE|nr:hypothetical protein H0235_007681 [Vespula pensylvanica]